MKREDATFIETVVKQLMYGLADQFIQDLENEPDENSPRKMILKKVYAQIDKEIPKIIPKLSDQGINTVEDVHKNPTAVSELMNKVQKRMEANADRLSERRRKKAKK